MSCGGCELDADTATAAIDYVVRSSEPGRDAHYLSGELLKLSEAYYDDSQHLVVLSRNCRVLD